MGGILIGISYQQEQTKQEVNDDKKRERLIKRLSRKLGGKDRAIKG